MSFCLTSLMILSSAILPVLFVSSFRSGSRLNLSRISGFISSIASLFSTTKVLFSSNRSSYCTAWFILFISFPCLTCSMVFSTCSGVRFSNLTLASSWFCCSVLIGYLIFILISSVFAAVNLLKLDKRHLIFDLAYCFFVTDCCEKGKYKELLKGNNNKRISWTIFCIHFVLLE